MNLGQNSFIPKFRGGGAERYKNAKFGPFLSQSIENQKLYNISKNQSRKSMGEGEMKIKSDVPPLSPLQIGL